MRGWRFRWRPTIAALRDPLRYLEVHVTSFSTRLCLVTDIKGYSRHSTPEQEDGQARLMRVMRFAFRHAGVHWLRKRDRQDRGDGLLYLMSANLDEAMVVPRLVIG